MVTESSIISPPVIAKIIKIFWNFSNFDMFTFSLALDLLGCPAYTSGMYFSFYISL